MNEIRLTPMELYFLGKMMHARYIEYAYIAAMPDIGKRYALHEQETLESLEAKGYIETDFSGDAEVSREVAAFLQPVFFSETETRLEADGRQYIFHPEKDRIIMADLQPGELRMKQMSDHDLRQLLRGSRVTVLSAHVRKGYSHTSYEASSLKEQRIQDEIIRKLKGEQ
ncbi:hypothetical protein [Chordicoccus furentiruminis]|uniref:hypothetical protein n=1 Tax=Chordicoccus furentiruminis TaxID=2709410 RepID=UPI0023A85C2D|nr:hypothetical protein [Chordicoccus furentiruminis]